MTFGGTGRYSIGVLWFLSAGEKATVCIGVSP
jgi:hypothetical protein